MRICMFGFEFPPLVFGGVGTHCYHLTKALSEMGVEIDFFMVKTKDVIKHSWLNIIQIPYTEEISSTLSNKVENVYYKCRDNLGPIRVFDNRKIIFNKNPRYTLDNYNFLCAQRALREHSKVNYDIFHFQNWITIKSLLYVIESLKVPTVLTIHGTELEREVKYNKIIGLENIGLTTADRIICVSKLLKERLKATYKINLNKLEIISNGIDFNTFRKSSKKKKEKEKIVLYTGRLSAEKSLDFLLKAAKKVLEEYENVKFYIIGRGPKLEELKKLTKKLNIDDKVVFKDFVSKTTKLLEIYSISDIYVLPSLHETFGITVLEAMASGIPAIVSRNTGVSGVVKNCLKVEYGDVEDLKNKILFLLKNEDARNKIARKAKEESKKFSWKEIAKQTIKVYEKLI